MRRSTRQRRPNRRYGNPPQSTTQKSSPAAAVERIVENENEEKEVIDLSTPPSKKRIQGSFVSGSSNEDDEDDADDSASFSSSVVDLTSPSPPDSKSCSFSTSAAAVVTSSNSSNDGESDDEKESCSNVMDSEPPSIRDQSKSSTDAMKCQSAAAMNEEMVDQESDDVAARTNLLKFRNPFYRSAVGQLKDDDNYSSDDAEEEEGMFPPTVFTDAMYTRGILVYPPKNSRPSKKELWNKITLNCPYFSLLPPHQQQQHQPYRYASCLNPPPPSSSINEVYTLPTLTKTESDVWLHKHAAVMSAARRFPFSAVRLLGIVTLYFEEEYCAVEAENEEKGRKRRKYKRQDSTSSTASFASTSRNATEYQRTKLEQERQVYHEKQFNTINPQEQIRRRIPKDNHTRLCKKFNKYMAKKEALKHFSTKEWGEWEQQLEKKKEEVYNMFQTLEKDAPCLECWDLEHGGFDSTSLYCNDTSVSITTSNETSASTSNKRKRKRPTKPKLSNQTNANLYNDNYTPLPILQKWLNSSSYTVHDHQANRTKSYYNNLKSIPTDATSIFSSLIELSNPKDDGLYDVPLLTPYPVASIVEQHTQKKKITTRYKVRIGIYTHRLLPEILTLKHLQIIMSALDEGSFLVSEPLHLPPVLREEERVFCSCEFPQVVFEKEEEMEVVVVEEEEEKKEESEVENQGRRRGRRNGCSRGGKNKRKNASVQPSETATSTSSTKKEVKNRDLTITNSTRDEKTISPFTVRGLMKLMESGGNDCSNWPEIEKTLAPILQLSLMLHQKHAICWMIQMESLSGFGINSILWEERQFLDGDGKYYYSPALGQIRLEPPPIMKGGILADEMGLGKTVEVLGLVVATLEELKTEMKVENCKLEVQKLHWHATLIIVPPALLRQWICEIKKATGDALEVHSFDATTLQFVAEITRSTELNNDEENNDSPDIVVATYGALDKPRSSKVLTSINWGRIVLDEMQEIRSSTTAIARNCERLSCSRRWMLSGTPLFEGIGDLRGELNFLRLEPYAAALEDGFFDFSITNHWKARSEHGLETLRILGLLLLRRAKDMTLASTGEPILGLKGLTVEFVPIPQSPSERALYCWMEYIVSEDLAHRNELEDSAQSRNMCLRLLRLLCISPVLVNGGLGASSQLQFIQRVMIRANRRLQLQEEASWRANSDHPQPTGTTQKAGAKPQRRPKKHQIRVLSCDGALRFLSQVQSAANVDSDFISDVTFGVGGGVANRNRATVSAEDMLKEAENDMKQGSKDRSVSIKKRATLRWQIALEKITTGSLLHEHSTRGVCSKFSNLWKWRFLTAGLMAERRGINSSKIPILLCRGWRPSPSFIKEELSSAHPEFLWAHPLSLQLDMIPKQVTVHEVTESVHEACKKEPKASQTRALILAKLRNETRKIRRETLEEELVDAEHNLRLAKDHDVKMEKDGVLWAVKLFRETEANFWSAFLQFNNKEDMQFLIRRAESANGVSLKSETTVPHVQERIDTAEARLQEADSENKVYPCIMNHRKVIEAKKKVRQAGLGLRIFFDERWHSDINYKHAKLSRAMGPHRSLAPKTTAGLLNSARDRIHELTSEIFETSEVIEVCKKKIKRLKSSMGVSGEIRELSAFETLDALAHNELEKTKCPICLASFGAALEEASQKKTDRSIQPVVAMISCGHLFCIDCLDRYTHQQLAMRGRVACPNCRKNFLPDMDVIHVDHNNKTDGEQRNSQRQDAKAKVREASKMLEESNGQLDGSMWHALFLSFDLPEGVNRRGHSNFPAIPREVLAHMRKATGMDVHCDRNIKPNRKYVGFSSKVRALLNDLNRDERSVVFAASKESVRHLAVVLEVEGIGCRALFTGQNPSKSEQAVTEWETDKATDDKSIPSCPVLIVQSGAAASGLTLTAASKIFLMEPFMRQEEEQQAYARCHRFGQKREVHVKCYYSPVTVESRLLEWRKRGRTVPSVADTKDGSTTFIYSNFSDEKSEDEMTTPLESSESSDDTKRTNFLLNLTDV